MGRKRMDKKKMEEKETRSGDDTDEDENVRWIKKGIIEVVLK